METELDILLQGFTEAERASLLALGQPQRFAVGEVVLSAGRSEWDVYVVREGEVSVWVGNVRLADLGPGHTLGTSAVLYPQLQWSAVRGKVDGSLLRVPREALLAFLDSCPRRRLQQFTINVFRIWVDVLKRRNERIVQIQQQLLTVGPGPRVSRHKLLLAVDDDEETLAALEEEFGERYQIATARGDAEVMERALSDRPDLVLLYLHMPRADGFAVCRHLKMNPDTGHIPIVIVSPLSAIPDKVKGLMYGADEYLIKPVELLRLRQTVRSVLERAYGGQR